MFKHFFLECLHVEPAQLLLYLEITCFVRIKSRKTVTFDPCVTIVHLFFFSLEAIKNFHIAKTLFLIPHQVNLKIFKGIESI